MRYLLPLIAFVFICGYSNAQSDSTEIKLSQYKDLFIKGLITAQEYETLKQQTLGIKTPQKPIVVIEQKESKIDTASLRRLQANGNTNVIAGSIFVAMGVSFGATAGVLWRRGKIEKIPMILLSTTSGLIGVAGIVILPIGISQIGRYNKHALNAGLVVSNEGVGLRLSF